jgi:hypothetical protein
VLGRSWAYSCGCPCGYLYGNYYLPKVSTCFLDSFFFLFCNIHHYPHRDSTHQLSTLSKPYLPLLSSQSPFLPLKSEPNSTMTSISAENALNIAWAILLFLLAPLMLWRILRQRQQLGRFVLVLWLVADTVMFLYNVLSTRFILILLTFCFNYRNGILGLLAVFVKTKPHAHIALAILDFVFARLSIFVVFSGVVALWASVHASQYRSQPTSHRIPRNRISRCNPPSHLFSPRILHLIVP